MDSRSSLVPDADTPWRKDIRTDITNFRDMCSITMFQKDQVKIIHRDFPSGPVGKTAHSQCRGPGFDPWQGN